MALPTFNFTTGPSTLMDIGTLSYNGCVFSPLFVTTVSGKAVKDNAQRTVKYMEYLITADGYVTAPTNVALTGVNATTAQLRNLLTAQGGAFVYEGRGCDIVVNPAGGGAGVGDVVWGPVPELLEFQPLGGGLCAKVQWQVKVHITEVPQSKGGSFVTLAALAPTLLQFNYETVVTYTEDGFSVLSASGTLEIPMTRVPSQKTRTLTTTVDALRSQIETRVMTGIDLTRFHVTNREFHVSRDKRTMDWSFTVEEKPYMDLPQDCTIARGTYNVRPARAGMGLCSWLCTLRATYVVRGPFRSIDGINNKPRRLAWLAFLALLRLRMGQSVLGNVVPDVKGNQNPAAAPVANILGAGLLLSAAASWKTFLNKQTQALGPTGPGANAWLIDFSFDEGLYLDSKTTSFSATWRLVTTFSHILLASGLWKKLPEQDAQGNNIWATSMNSVSKSQSWLLNQLDPKLDVIVDFGGG